MFMNFYNKNVTFTKYNQSLQIVKSTAFEDKNNSTEIQLWLFLLLQYYKCKQTSNGWFYHKKIKLIFFYFILTEYAFILCYFLVYMS